MQLIQGLQFKKYQPTVNDLGNLGIHLIFCLFSSFPKYTDNRTLLNDLGRQTVYKAVVYLYALFSGPKEKNVSQGCGADSFSIHFILCCRRLRNWI